MASATWVGGLSIYKGDTGWDTINSNSPLKEVLTLVEKSNLAEKILHGMRIFSACSVGWFLSETLRDFESEKLHSGLAVLTPTPGTRTHIEKIINM